GPAGRAGLGGFRPRAGGARSPGGRLARPRGKKKAGTSPSRPLCHTKKLSRLLNVLRLQPLRSLGDLELDRLAFGERTEALPLNRAVVDEHIRSVLARDEAVPLGVVEPLHSALRIRHLKTLLTPARKRRALSRTIASPKI